MKPWYKNYGMKTMVDTHNALKVIYSKTPINLTNLFFFKAAKSLERSPSSSEIL